MTELRRSPRLAEKRTKEVVEYVRYSEHPTQSPIDILCVEWLIILLGCFIVWIIYAAIETCRIAYH
jgi:hypothetical protein